ncbi:Peroxisomal leader peptide-processing protease [Cyphomyrmex costatus]|uniref:Peroxisomal leader peptide-processing protease n=1 Tax=Cyphomyrmex costatus TaxID=456900 RepID=A0A195CSZ4_9HYME|nr:Peroxisomal leader peptide-processing protease [Cyphomyrmex costatus]
MDTPSSALLLHSSIDKDPLMLPQGYSGISISMDWILTHGIILSPIIDKSYAVLNFVTNMVPGELITVPRELQNELKFRVYHHLGSDDDSRSSSLKEHHGMIVAAWQCPLLKKTFDEFFKTWSFPKSSEVTRSLRSIFLFIRIYNSGESIVETSLEQALSCLLDQVPPNLIRGSSVIIESTPFGNPVFAGSIAHGVISNIVGDEDCVIMTDAYAFPGGEGGPVYIIPPNCKRRIISGMVIAPLSWCRGEWVDYTFAANLAPCVFNILRKKNLSCRPITSQENADVALDRGVVLVRCGINWGTGVLVHKNTGTFLTCSHVIAEAPEREISVVMRPDKANSCIRAKLLYRTPENQPYDVAVLRVDPQDVDPSLRSVRLSRTAILKGNLQVAFRVLLGEPIVSVGFPFSSCIRPTISGGVVSKSMECALLTTCCVQSGTSGGPIVSRATGDMLGMVVCNVLSSDGSMLYPRMSLAVPAATLSGPLREYLRTDSQ